MLGKLLATPHTNPDCPEVAMGNGSAHVISVMLGGRYDHCDGNFLGIGESRNPSALYVPQSLQFCTPDALPPGTLRGGQQLCDLPFLADLGL